MSKKWGERDYSSILKPESLLPATFPNAVGNAGEFELAARHIRNSDKAHTV